MPSVSEQITSEKSFARHFADTFAAWNRKLHFYIGLFMLFFLWLFSFTGLLINHTSWKFAEFWSSRKQAEAVQTIVPPPAGSDLDQAKDIMRQSGIEGEIEWTTTRPDPGRFEFRVTRPGYGYDISTDLAQNRVTVHSYKLNVWGLIRVLHTFTGVRMADPKNQRDWGLTTLWAYSMDAVAAGLIVMVLSSYYMWWVLIRKRVLGAISLALGVVSCGLFVIGLRWMTS
jgi:hypothetical protein